MANIRSSLLAEALLAGLAGHVRPVTDDETRTDDAAPKPVRKPRLTQSEAMEAAREQTKRNGVGNPKHRRHK